MRRKILAILLAISTIVCMMPVMSFAESDTLETGTVSEELQGGTKVAYPEIDTEQEWTGEAIQLVKSQGDVQGVFTLKQGSTVIGNYQDYWKVKATDVGDYIVQYTIPSKGVQNVNVKIRKVPTAEFTLNPDWNGTTVTKLFSDAKFTDPDKKAASSNIQVNTKLKDDGSLGSSPKGWADFKLTKDQVGEDGTVTIYYAASNLDNKVYFTGNGYKHPRKLTITVIDKTPVVAENLTYNTKEQQLITKGYSEHYWLDSESAEFDDIEDVVATDAGEYKVYYGKTFNENQYVTVTIAPFTLSHENFSAAEVIYNGKVQKPSIECKIDEDTTVVLVEGKDYNLTTMGKGFPVAFEGATNPMVYNGTLATIWISGKGNYTTGSGVSITLAWSIRALDPVAETLVYNGDEQNLIDYDKTQDYTENYKYEYSLDGETWTKTIAAEDVDTYNVQWRLMMLKKGMIPALDYWCQIDTGTVEATIVPLNVFEGADAKYTQKSKKALTFKCNGEFKFFDHILVDGELVDTDNYIPEEGSTVITLKDTYLDTLKVGKHTLTICYNGEAATVDAEFEVLAAIDTGDSNNAFPYAALLLMSILGFAGYGLKKRQH